MATVKFIYSLCISAAQDGIVTGLPRHKDLLIGYANKSEHIRLYYVRNNKLHPGNPIRNLSPATCQT